MGGGKGDFASLMEGSGRETARRAARTLHNGEIVEGTVIQIGADAVFLDVGTTADGRLERADVLDRSGKLTVAVGDRIKATVVDANDAEGPLLATSVGRNKIDAAALTAAAESGMPVEGAVTRAVKGGLEVEVGGVRAFCPASQADVGFTKELDDLVGSTERFRVLEVRDGGRSVIVSRRAIIEEELEKRGRDLAASLEPGTDVEGVVTAIQKYGAFVDLGGVEGLVHISELSRARVDRVEDVVSVGDRIAVRVLGIEPGEQGPRIRLSRKALEQGARPDDAPKKNEVLTGTVSKIAAFGVFVDTDRGAGLVPVRELGLSQGADHRKAFSVGDEIQVVLSSRDRASGKLTFSARAVAAVEERENFEQFGRPDRSSAGLGSLGDVLRKKLGLPDPPPEPERPSRPEPAPAVERASREQEPTRRAAAPVAPPAPKKPTPPRERKAPPEGVVRRRKKPATPEEP